jgi:hypothetical protein
VPLELTTIAPDGELEQRVLGDLEEIVRSRDWLAQALVPAGSWQGARLAGGPHLPAQYAWALVSCIVTPGFDFSDFEIGEREALRAEFPSHAGVIGELT